VKAGSTVSLANENGDTALTLAEEMGHRKIIGLLKH
jgi:ankyrin repeat protein